MNHGIGWGRAQALLALFLLGLMVTVELAVRDTRAGYRFRLWNQTTVPLEVYAVVPLPGTAGKRELRLGSVPAGGQGGWWGAPPESQELVFAPLNEARRLGRLGFDSAVVRRVGNKDVPLVICLRQTDVAVFGAREVGECAPLRPGWNLPLLYIAGVGWCGTFWFKRRSVAQKSA